MDRADALRYTFPQNADVRLTAGPRTGNWKSVFTTPATPKADVTNDIFSFSIAHGTRPSAAAYAYAVGPAGAAPPFKIIANTALVQAIAGDDTAQFAAAVFWSAGTTALNGVSWQVDAPCLILHSGGRDFVSDPTQNLKSIRLVVAGKSATVALPQGGDAGKSVEAVFHQ